MNKPLILIVEDDAAIRNLIATTLETQDYRFHTCLLYTSSVTGSIRRRPLPAPVPTCFSSYRP